MVCPCMYVLHNQKENSYLQSVCYRKQHWKCSKSFIFWQITVIWLNTPQQCAEILPCKVTFHNYYFLQLVNVGLRRKTIMRGVRIINWGRRIQKPEIKKNLIITLCSIKYIRTSWINSHVFSTRKKTTKWRFARKWTKH